MSGGPKAVVMLALSGLLLGFYLGALVALSWVHWMLTS